MPLVVSSREKRYNITMTKNCDDCGVKLHGQCIVDGGKLMCLDCAEAFNDEQEFGRVDDREETDGDIFDDRMDMYMNEY